MPDGSDTLLMALSSRREVSLLQFRKLFDQAWVEAARKRAKGGPASGHWQALRVLSFLGHIDAHFGQGNVRIVVAPPALAILPGIGSRAILCGARSPAVLEALKKKASARGMRVTESHSGPYAPSTVAACATSPDDICDLAGEMNLQCAKLPPALLLASAAASLEECERDLTWNQSPELNWQREDFDVSGLRFLPPKGSEPRLSRYENPTRKRQHYQLWRDGRWAEIDLDWGRYAILALSSRRVLRYDASKRSVRVSYRVPPPALLARSLGLCSGRYSTSEDGGENHYVFGNVPPSIFKMISRKLKQ